MSSDEEKGVVEKAQEPVARPRGEWWILRLTFVFAGFAAIDHGPGAVHHIEQAIDWLSGL